MSVCSVSGSVYGEHSCDKRIICSDSSASSTPGRMILKETTRLELPAAADMHVHLRQGKMMELVVPQIRKGGVDTVFVMVSPRVFHFV